MSLRSFHMMTEIFPVSESWSFQPDTNNAKYSSHIYCNTEFFELELVHHNIYPSLQISEQLIWRHIVIAHKPNPHSLLLL